MEILSVILQVIIAGLLICNIALAKRAERKLADFMGEETDFLDEEIIDTDDHTPTAYEQHLAKREAEFDQRIENMKRELSENAETLHPDVYNLPHNEIKETNPPDVEEYTV